MQKDAAGGRFEDRHSLRQQAADDARQHIPRTGRREPGGQIAGDGGAAVGMSDHRVRPFEHQRRTAEPRRLARAFELRARFDPGKEPRELAFVRRQDHRPARGRG